MRYLLTVIVVLALASPAMSICTTPDKHLGSYNDSQLPQTLGPYSTTDCDLFDWEWDFYRTDKTKPGLIITIEIVGTTFSQDCNSKDYAEGDHSDNGTASVTSDTNTLSMSRGVSMESGYFNHIDLWVTDYRAE